MFREFWWINVTEYWHETLHEAAFFSLKYRIVLKWILKHIMKNCIFIQISLLYHRKWGKANVQNAALPKAWVAMLKYWWPPIRFKFCWSISKLTLEDLVWEDDLIQYFILFCFLHIYFCMLSLLLLAFLLGRLAHHWLISYLNAFFFLNSTELPTLHVFLHPQKSPFLQENSLSSPWAGFV